MYIIEILFVLCSFTLTLTGQWLMNLFTGRRTDFSVFGLTACTGIEDDIELDCDYPLTGGVNDRLILFNHADIVGTTRDGTNPRIVTSVTLASGARGYVVEGLNSSNEPGVNFVKKTYSGGWEHIIDFRVFNNNPTIKKNVDNMSSGKVVGLIQNNHVNADGTSVFEWYGLDSGLEMQTATRNQGDEELMGAWVIQLKSNAKALEAGTPHTFYVTDYITTKAAVEALIV